ncbi:MAG TPA: hypothetical protein VMU08_01380 [Rhizomicrobium sp.]|nr:hypothetical protein [Rhizomicrobium sp.]
MNRIAVSATFGILAGAALAGAYFGAPYAGYQLSPTTLVVIAASVVFGSAICIAALNLAKAAEKPAPGGLMTLQLKRANNMVEKFPGRDGALDLVVRADQKIDQLEVVKNPESYKTKDITVRLKGGGSTKFNPVDLVQLFAALKQQPGFIHLLLLDKNDEFVGYLPGFAAKREFTGANAESVVTKYIIKVFEDDSNSANLPLIDGAGKFDTISDEAKISDVLAKMAGGFKRLVVLKNGYHRRPVGLVNFNDLMIGTIKGGAPETTAAALPIGAFR